jgi:hypothetical protein
MQSEYAEIVRRAMKNGGRTPNKGRITRRQLEKGARYSYEHLRKILAGEAVASEECNAAICRFLGLDEHEMWQIARAEKLRHKHPDIASRILAPADTALREVWNELTQEQKLQLKKLAEGMAAQNKIRHDLAAAS